MKVSNIIFTLVEKMKTNQLRVVLLLLFLLASPIAYAGGKELYATKGCVSCHGDAGKKALLPNYPTLAGQNSAYLVQQMKDLKSGARANGQSAVMKPFTLALTEADMKQISDYLSKQR